MTNALQFETETLTDKAGYSYEDCLQQVSYEMKHNRASITQHYLA